MPRASGLLATLLILLLLALAGCGTVLTADSRSLDPPDSALVVRFIDVGQRDTRPWSRPAARAT